MAIERIAIKFDRSATPYTKDEIAGFSRERAALYVKHGIAHYCNPDTGEKVSTPIAKKVLPQPINPENDRRNRVDEGARVAEALDRLSNLLEKKVLSPKEFETQKAKLLAA